MSRRSFIRPRAIRPVHSVGAGNSSAAMARWSPRRVTKWGEMIERQRLGVRAEDLVANDPHASSVVGSVAANVVGPMIRPQSAPAHKRLGISEEEAAELAESMEWAWSVWVDEAHVRGVATFYDLQFMSVRSILTKGEFLFLPRMLERPGRRFSLALLDVHPSRLVTPTASLLDSIHDGVEIDEDGARVAYHIANPEPSSIGSIVNASNCVRVPAFFGHRPGVLHGFPPLEEETYRGSPILKPAMKFFRSLNDSLDYELVAQILQASFPVFIKSNPPTNKLDQAPQYDENGQPVQDGEPVYHQTIAPGQILYGNRGEEPELLASNRPGNNWESFTTLILRAMAAASGVSYEVMTKDFSKTNYSSARAALLETWKTYAMYRVWLVRQLCVPVWRMVQEEAFLRGMIKLPKGAPDFYDAIPEYCNVSWIGPARGFVDPVKEVLSYQKAIETGLMSRARAVAEMGEDVEDVDRQIARDRRREERLGMAQENANVD